MPEPSRLRDRQATWVQPDPWGEGLRKADLMGAESMGHAIRCDTALRVQSHTVFTGHGEKWKYFAKAFLTRTD